MTLSWTALVLLCLAAALAWFWQDSLAARERANAAAMEACERLSLQFLDGTVAFAGLSFVRDVGRLRLRRTYVFDYTANSIERRQGFVVMVGGRIDSVGYASETHERAASAALRPQSGVQPPEPGKVLSLEERRANTRGSNSADDAADATQRGRD